MREAARWQQGLVPTERMCASAGCSVGAHTAQAGALRVRWEGLFSGRQSVPHGAAWGCMGIAGLYLEQGAQVLAHGRELLVDGCQAVGSLDKRPML